MKPRRQIYKRVVNMEYDSICGEKNEPCKKLRPEHRTFIKVVKRHTFVCKSDIIGRAEKLKKSARFLNRVISFGEDSIQFEADQRLVEAIVEGLGLKDSTPVTAPGTKPKPISRAEVQ